jgi:hypothetical protein
MIEGRRYVVKSGDNLWKIAKSELGCGSQFPRIFKFNNRRDVMQVTRSIGIEDADEIYPGQHLLIPILPGTRHCRSVLEPEGLPVAPPVGQARPPRSPETFAIHRPPRLHRELEERKMANAYKFKLDDLSPKIVIDQPGVSVELKWSGDVVLMSQQVYPVVHQVGGFGGYEGGEMRHQMAANRAFESLIDDVRLSFDPRDGKLSFRTMLASAEKQPEANSAIGLSGDFGKPVKLRYEFIFPKLEGTTPTGSFKYYGVSVKAVVELTVMPKPPATLKAAERRWDALLGIGLVSTVAAIMFADVLSDYVTMGLGVGKDAVVTAFAGSLWMMGMERFGRLPTSSFPRASVPAHVQMRVRFDVPDA